MVEANLKGIETKNRINCVDIETVIQECISEEQEKKITIISENDLRGYQLLKKSKSLKELLNKGKYNNRYTNELKDIKYVKSQIHYRNFGTY